MYTQFSMILLNHNSDRKELNPWHKAFYILCYNQGSTSLHLVVTMPTQHRETTELNGYDCHKNQSSNFFTFAQTPDTITFLILKKDWLLCQICRQAAAISDMFCITVHILWSYLSITLEADSRKIACWNSTIVIPNFGADWTLSIVDVSFTPDNKVIKVFDAYINMSLDFITVCMFLKMIATCIFYQGFTTQCIILPEVRALDFLESNTSALTGYNISRYGSKMRVLGMNHNSLQ